MALRLINASTRATVASTVELALDRNSRRRGLLGRRWLAATSAMVISPCWMVHTAFMKFPIDVLFVDAEGHVVHMVTALRPWRIAVSPRARMVIEMAPGAAAQRDINVGDQVTLVEDGGEPQAVAKPHLLPLEVQPC